MPQDNGRHNQDRNSSSSNLLLYAGLIVATGVLAAMLVVPFFTREVRPEDLKALIEASSHVTRGGDLKPEAEGQIDVQINEGTKQRHFRYSKLRQVVFKERSIVGYIGVVELTPHSPANSLYPMRRP